MKHNYQDILARKRGEHNLKRKNCRYEPYKISVPEYVSLNSGYKSPKDKNIPAPNNFSFIENHNESIKFLNDSKHYIEDMDTKIKQDFRYIDNVTPDAILYMMAYIDDMKYRSVEFSITGTFPTKKSCRKLFDESGFLEHLKSQKDKLNNIVTDMLTIKVGTHTNTQIAQDVVKYVRKWLNIDRTKTKPLYKILIECMTNTKNHAFKKNINEDNNQNESENKNYKWYLMAYHINGEVHFVFLDNGYGIAKTIRKNWKDLFTGKRFDDNKLVLSALEGEILRSQTGEAKRGKGLPYIYKSAKEEHIKELIIITNKAFINCKNDTTQQIDSKLNGTLISWKIKKDDSNA